MPITYKGHQTLEHTWQDKANRLIADASFDAYTKANKGRKRHVPYSIPQYAEDLVECLAFNDEERAKAIFIRHADGWAR
jgi:hypothetical protein